MTGSVWSGLYVVESEEGSILLLAQVDWFVEEFDGSVRFNFVDLSFSVDNVEFELFLLWSGNIDFDGEFNVHLFFIVAGDVPGHSGDFLSDFVSDTESLSVDVVGLEVACEGSVDQ